MKIVAAMAYYDDDLFLLDRSLRSIPTVADSLVVCDGRYARYMPDAPAASPKEHLDFIRATCKEIGLPVTIDVPRKVYAGQVEKRSRLLALASEGADWIVGVDADHIFHGVRVAFRDEIASLEDEDAVDLTYYTPLNRDRPLKESAAGLWHESLAGDYAVITAVFRALPELRVEDRHWWYSAMKDGRRVWVWGGDGRYQRVKVRMLKAPMLIEHACLFRQPKHILANRAFCEDRERIVKRTGQEDAVEMVAA